MVGDETGKAAPSAEQVTTHLSTLDQNMGQMQGQISSVETQLRVLNGTVAQFVSALSPQPASGGETAEALTNAAARLEGVARQKTERSAVEDESVEWSRRALITGFDEHGVASRDAVVHAHDGSPSRMRAHLEPRASPHLGFCSDSTPRCRWERVGSASNYEGVLERELFALP